MSRCYGAAAGRIGCTGIRRVSRFVAGLLRQRPGKAKTPQPIRPKVESLEQRIALFYGPRGAATGCTCPFCSTGASYTLGNSGSNNAYTAAGYKWDEPSGLGSPVTITYSYSNLLDGKLGLSACRSTVPFRKPLAVGPPPPRCVLSKSPIAARRPPQAITAKARRR